MSPSDLLWQAGECQKLARRLAPLQNAVVVTAERPDLPPRPPLLRRVWVALGLVAPPAPPAPATLSAETVGHIVSHLLSAGNLLETIAKEGKT